MDKLLFLSLTALLLALPIMGWAQQGGEGAETRQAEEHTSTDSLEDELDRLETELGEDASEPAESTSASSRTASRAAGAIQSMNPNISFILDTAFAWFSDPDSVDLRGGHDPQQLGFNLQGLELAVSAAIDPYVRFDSAVLFSLFGVEIEEAYGTTLALPAQLQMRFGQYKTEFGRLNPTHMHSWAFVTQPLVNAKFFGGESLRGLGVELSQLVLWMPGTFQWTVSAQNVVGEATGRSFVPTNDEVQDLLDLTLTARAEEFVALSNNLDLLVGASYAVGKNKSGRDNITEIYGTDLYLKWNSRTSGGRSQVGWQTEAMVRRRQIPNGVLEDFGMYSRIRWRPGRFWGAGLRYEYVSGVDPTGEDSSLFGGSLLGDSGPVGVVDPLDPDWTEARQRGAVQASYYPSHFSRLRLQYSLDYLPFREGSDLDELNHMIFLQADLVSGAHGAHGY